MGRCARVVVALVRAAGALFIIILVGVLFILIVVVVAIVLHLHMQRCCKSGRILWARCHRRPFCASPHRYVDHANALLRRVGRRMSVQVRVVVLVTVRNVNGKMWVLGRAHRVGSAIFIC